MKKFKIECQFPLSGKELYLLNRSFYDTEWSERTIFGRLSSYHQKEQFKADWVRYPNLISGDFIICGSEEEYSFEEAMLFIACNNGIGLTRDNLFAGINLFKDQILSKIEIPSRIIALMGEDFLPEHLSYENRRICPLISLGKRNEELDTLVDNIEGDHDWWWIDEQFGAQDKFVFLKPHMQKN